MSTLFHWLEAGRRLAERIPYSLVALIARVAVAVVFWKSALTKVDDAFRIEDKTFTLFEYEYQVPLLPTEIAAYLATYQELIGAILLVIGLATRLTALAFIGMVAVIQFFVYPNAWPTHLLWFALLLLIVARGPGAISLDHLIWRRRED